LASSDVKHSETPSFWKFYMVQCKIQVRHYGSRTSECEHL